MSKLVLLVTVYVSLDLANPLMPGALMLGIEDTVQVRQPERVRAYDDSVLMSGMAPSEPVGRIECPPRVRRAPEANDRSRPFHIQRARSLLAAPAPPSEDHH